MKTRQDIAVFLLRIALATGFLSAVASRLNLWEPDHPDGKVLYNTRLKPILSFPLHLLLFGDPVNHCGVIFRTSSSCRISGKKTALLPLSLVCYLPWR